MEPSESGCLDSNIIQVKSYKFSMLNSWWVDMHLQWVGWLNSVNAKDGMPYAKVGAPSEEPKQADQEPFFHA